SAERPEDDRPAIAETPRPGAPPVDHLLPGEALVGAEERRPRDDAPDEDVEQAAEGDDLGARHEQRPVPLPVEHVDVEDEEGRAREERDDRRGAREAAQLARECERLLADGEARGYFGRRHRGAGSFQGVIGSETDETRISWLL